MPMTLHVSIVSVVYNTEGMCLKVFPKLSKSKIKHDLKYLIKKPGQAINFF
jgi:hypothetical protein